MSVSSALCKSIHFLKSNFSLKSINVSIKMNRQQRFLKVTLIESEPWVSNIFRALVIELCGKSDLTPHG